MERILEPQLMDEEKQALAYANADFSEPHDKIVEQFVNTFSGAQLVGNILDLGCGPGDITFRFAQRFPQTRLIGVDGAQQMINLAEQRKEKQAELGERISFVTGFIPGADIPQIPFDAIISTSFLHHLPDPQILWQTIKQHAGSGTKIFVADLYRPDSLEQARALVEENSADEPEILKTDFFNSLCAAFEPQEIEKQLAEANIDELTVSTISDRHVIVFGTKK